MSTGVHATPTADDPTAALEARPHGDDHPAATTELEALGRGRYLLGCGPAIALTREVTHIGRGMAADVRLDDHTVSSRHAIVVMRGAGVRILDDRSTNGTVVNGRRVDETELHDGDVVVLGRVVLTYRDLRPT